MKNSALFHTPLNRRAAMRIGASSLLGLSMGDMLRADSLAKRANQEGKAKSIIHLNLSGGFPAQESFDPKPEAPGEYRGPFNVAKTNTGEIFSENFARTAKVADKITVLRGCHCRIPDHTQATYHLYTGYLPTTVIDYPQMGSIVSQHFGSRKNLPPYVAVPGTNGFSGGTGYLSSKYAAFKTGADPGGRGKFLVKDFTIPENLSMEHFERRKSARDIIEGHIRSIDEKADTLETMDDFYKQAYTLLTSKEAQAAFSLEGEPDKIRELYGQGYTLKDRRAPAAVNERLLLARRLVEAGVRFVSIDYGGWDCHVNVRDTVEDRAPALDHAISGLITDLDQRGMLDSTLFMVTTEFGRTPKINKTNGRDHWARSYSMLLAGGGITKGQIYGASDATASEPAHDPVPLEDFLYTIYHQLGIEANDELLAFGTRPIEIVKGGKLIEGIIA